MSRHPLGSGQLARGKRNDLRADHRDGSSCPASGPPVVKFVNVGVIEHQRSAQKSSAFDPARNGKPS